MADRILHQIMAFYRWLADIVVEEVTGAATNDGSTAMNADTWRYINRIIHPCFHLEGKNLKSNFSFVNNILGERNISDVIKVLPSDVWFEIFRRFPAADLFSLKAVCKTFHRLIISDDLFARMHLNDFTKLRPNATRAIIISAIIPSHLNYYDPDTLTLSICYDGGRFYDWCIHVYSTAFGSPLINRINRDQVLDSYHGLLLVRICDQLLLCNPITRSYMFLPLIRISELDFTLFKIAYDDVSKLYKVFSLFRTSYRISLYVLEVHRDGALHSPRETTVMEVEVGSKVIDYQIKESVSVNGNVHWLMINTEQNYIVSANVTTEEVKTRICSVTKSFIQNMTTFFAANGKFYLGRISSIPNYELELWVMEGVDSENPNPSCMMSKTRIAFSLTLVISTSLYETRILGVFRDKVLIMITGHMYHYDMTSATFKRINVASVINNGIEYKSIDFKSCRIIEHIDSLICL